MKKQFLFVFLFVFAVGTADVFPFNAEMPMNRESAMTSVPVTVHILVHNTLLRYVRSLDTAKEHIPYIYIGVKSI